MPVDVVKLFGVEAVFLSSGTAEKSGHPWPHVGQTLAWSNNSGNIRAGYVIQRYWLALGRPNYIRELTMLSCCG